MILRVHHIGLVVEDLEKAVANYEKLFGTKATDFRNDQGKKDGVSHQLDARIMMPNRCWLHLVQNWNPDSRVNKFLKQHGEALEHVALETTDIEEEINHLREIGCPAMTPDSSAEKKTVIDPALCTGCGLCAQICPVSCIGTRPAGTGKEASK